MEWITNARTTWHKLWSVRLALAGAVLGAVQTLMSYLQPEKPALWWGLSTAALSIATAVVRLVAQPALENHQTQNQSPKFKPGSRLALITAAAAAFAVPMEGLRQVAYKDPPGIWTVCVGSTNDVVPGKVYTLAECNARLDAEMGQAVLTAARCAPGAPDGVLLAFSDAVFNLGPKIACDQKNSTAARYLAAGDWPAACNQLPRWDKASVAGFMVSLPGLTKRRAAEQKLCLQGL